MGEKPLSIDEAPGQTTSMGGAGPLGGIDAPPPGIAAAGINTTRSNIKHAGAMDGGGGGDAADPTVPAPMAGAGAGSPHGELDDAPPPGSGAAGIITTRSNIKHSGGVRSEPTRPGDPFPQDTGPGQAGGSAGGIQAPQADEGAIAIKEQGIKHGEDGPAPEADAPGVAATAPPIPGVDIIVKKDPPR